MEDRHARVVAGIHSLLAELPPTDDAESVAHLAASLLAPAEQPDEDPALFEAVLAGFESARSEVAAGVLAAIAALGAARHAAPAREALERLRAAGVASPYEEVLQRSYEVREAWFVEHDPIGALAGVLQRPDGPEQALLLMLADGCVTSGDLGPRLTDEPVRTVLGRSPMVAELGAEPVALSPDELRERVRTAWQRSRDQLVSVSQEVATLRRLLARPLLGDPDALPWLELHEEEEERRPGTPPPPPGRRARDSRRDKRKAARSARRGNRR